jgi:cyclic-di-GMP phosphodiesterase, flagellum assembly factor TipF
MVRISTIFIAICMVLVAASLGLVLHSVGGINGTESAIVALTALTFLILYNAVSMRLRDRSDVGTQIADLSRGTADLACQVAEFGRRLAAVESRTATANSGISEKIQKLHGEINELGSLVKQVATSVAAHEDILAAAAADPAAPSPTGPVNATQALADEGRDVPPLTAAGDGFQAPTLEASPWRSHAQILGTLKTAVEQNRLDIYLQPMVSLPQRKVRFYEAVTRLHDGNQVLAAEDFIGIAEAAGLVGRIDHMVMLRCVQVLRRLMVRSKDVGVFCNVAASTLVDPATFSQCLDFLEANRALAPSLILEFKQADFRNLGPIEVEHLAALAQRGYRFSIDHVSDLRIDPREFADRGVRYIKVPAALLLDPRQISTSDIHPSDLSDLLGRFGIDLIAERIEGERAVVDLLDYDVRFGQGFLFAPPRPLRPEGAAAAAASAPEPKPGPSRAPEQKSQSSNGYSRPAFVPPGAIEQPPRSTGNAALARRAAGST